MTLRERARYRVPRGDIMAAADFVAGKLASFTPDTRLVVDLPYDMPGRDGQLRHLRLVNDELRRRGWSIFVDLSMLPDGERFAIAGRPPAGDAT